MAAKVHNLSQNHSNGETSNGSNDNEGSGPIQTRARRFNFLQFDGRILKGGITKQISFFNTTVLHLTKGR